MPGLEPSPVAILRSDDLRRRRCECPNEAEFPQGNPTQSLKPFVARHLDLRMWIKARDQLQVSDLYNHKNKSSRNGSSLRILRLKTNASQFNIPFNETFKNSLSPNMWDVWLQFGQTNADMFCTKPKTGISTLENIWAPRLASTRERSWGVETMTAPGSPSDRKLGNY